MSKLSFPLVSIVITSYNKENFIIESIKSAIYQTYQNIEIIVVDDASSDNSLEKIIDFVSNQPKIRIVCNQSNKGVIFCRNIGISKSKGKYILPLDGDDIIANNYAELAVEYMESHENCGICYCEAVKFRSASSFEKWDLPKYSLETMSQRNCIFCTAFFRKSDWSLIGGYDPDFYFGFEDWNFWLKILELNRSTYKIPKILFYYRKGSNERSIIANRNLEKAMQLIYEKNKWIFNKPEVLQIIATRMAEFEIHKKDLKKNRKLRILIKVSYAIIAIMLFINVLLYHV